MYKVLKCSWSAVILPIRSFVCHILIAVTVVVCLRSLIKTLGRLEVLQDNTFNYNEVVKLGRMEGSIIHITFPSSFHD